MADKAAISKAVGLLVSAILTFVLNLAIIKLGWNAVLTQIFPTLPQITWYQALILLWICGALFKQPTVRVTGND